MKPRPNRSRQFRPVNPRVRPNRSKPAISTALRDNEKQMRAVLETAVEGIITIDARGTIESINPAGLRIFGYRQQELLGRSVNLLMPRPYAEEHDGYIANYLRTGKARIIGIGREVLGRRKDGVIIPIELAVSEVRLAERRIFTGFVRDITERKRLEQDILDVSEREQRRIGRDLHDGLGQHLAGIEMMSQVLGQELKNLGLSAPARRAAGIARYVREAIGHARALARGLASAVLETEGLRAALEDLAENTSRLFGIPCQVQCGGAFQIGEGSAGTHLFRIAQEAVSNAIKHSQTRRIDISLESEGDRIRLAIRDFGRPRRKRAVARQGMGLRIMQYRAHLLGGSFSAGAHPASGTIVCCTIPAPLPKKPLNPPAHENQARRESSHPHRR